MNKNKTDFTSQFKSLAVGFRPDCMDAAFTCGVWGSFRWRVQNHRSPGWDRSDPQSWRLSSWTASRSVDPPSVCGLPADTHRRSGVWRTCHWCGPGCHSPALGICREQREKRKQRKDEQEKKCWSQRAGKEIKRMEARGLDKKNYTFLLKYIFLPI